MRGDDVGLRFSLLMNSFGWQLRRASGFSRVEAAARAGESPTRAVGHDHTDAAALMAKNDDDSSTQTPDTDSSPPAPTTLPTSSPKKSKRRRGPRREPKQWLPEGLAPGDLPLSVGRRCDDRWRESLKKKRHCLDFLP